MGKMMIGPRRLAPGLLAMLFAAGEVAGQEALQPQDSALALRRQAAAAYQAGTRAELERALDLLLGASELLRGGQAGPALGATLHDIGFILARLGREASALDYLQEALDVRDEVGDRPGQARTARVVAQLHELAGRPETAIPYYRIVLEIAREFGDERLEAEILQDIGRVHQFAFSRPDLGTAVAHYDSAASIVMSVRAQGSDRAQLSYVDTHTWLFEWWSLAWLGLASEIGPGDASLAALAAADRGRAQGLRDLRRAWALSGGAQRLAVGYSPGMDLGRQAERWVADLQDRDVSTLYYLVTARELVVWLVPPSGAVRHWRRPIDEDSLSALIAGVRGALGVNSGSAGSGVSRTVLSRLVPTGQRGLEVAARGTGEWRESARRLGQVLFPLDLLDRVDDAEEIVLVPHGSLWLVPFASLPVGEAGEILGRRYALSYSPSLAAIVEVTPSRHFDLEAIHAEAERRVLVVGNPDMPVVPAPSGRQVDLPSLSGAAEEARHVAGLFGATPLVGPQATEEGVKRRIGEAALVHLATHGLAYGDSARAGESFVALAAGGGEDGLLTVDEVRTQVDPLRAELVVLSACQTGLGDLYDAEGIVGLQRAFLGRGAKSVLVSLWNVSDDATRRLMESFYTHWLGGGSKAQALRRAQEEVRRTPGFEHPRYWAPFQLVAAN